MNSLRWNRLVPFLFGVLLLAQAPETRAAEAWLMTYGKADRVEERFGHNALWIRDPARGVDRIYNFGFFDFDTPGFYFDYLFGDLIYYAVARDPAEELAYYRWRDRSVRAQRLDLDDPTIRRLTDWLDLRVAPENRNFRYDYYLNNCSTRIRDALDYALDGALGNATQTEPARLTFREHTRRLMRPDPLLYLGIQAALGPGVDRPRTVWDEMFLPDVVAEVAAGFRLPDGEGGSRPLVVDDRMLHVSQRPEPAAVPGFPWVPVLGLMVGGLALLLVPYLLFRRRGLKLAGWRAWLTLDALAGGLLLFLWLATDHLAAGANQNVLLLNPLLVLLWRARGGRFERWIASVVIGLLVALLVIKAFGSGQWNNDLLLALAPVQLAALWVWHRSVPAEKARAPA
ncbi:DUF4105 domain-containing protein [Wenzhouxiangella sp. XN79A]|uniref:lipoprotein N-acyltransferase Lnb domain-containing protein n=1 Tax=Wenzhouxiangella sp. XN79A TaxID=2724193 RepID=UPI00144AF1E5|nr:DUF4105 domain-containing protein [Wenzhouxiangella sp. XN79A]NKI33717.1 DUF4105 domain-containing protein [Wenzhouxiangella sp. XN79A]